MMQQNGSFQVDFCGVGVAKAGTTWLAQCLSEHPQICMAADKEPDFFSTEHPTRTLPVQGRARGTSHHAKGIDWYESQFSHRQPGQILGEFSVAYFGDPTSPSLLHEHNPDMKLLVCYRDPVEATYALYHQLSQHQPLHESFEEMIKRPEMLDYFYYHANTLRFADCFPLEQMLFLLHDDMKADPQGTYSKVCRFLDVDDTVCPPSLHRAVNVRRVVHRRWLRDIRCVLSAILGANKLTRAIRTCLWRVGIGKFVARFFRRGATRVGQYDPMSTEAREALRTAYRKENLRLAELTSLDLRKWH